MDITFFVGLIVALGSFTKWMLTEIDKKLFDNNEKLLKTFEKDFVQINSLIFEINASCTHKSEILDLKLNNLKESFNEIENFLDTEESLKFKKRRSNED